MSSKIRKGISFISFEGLDGSGKTTQVNLLAEYFTHEKIDFLLVREPGSSLIGEKVRDILKDNKNNLMSFKSELFLFMAARAQLMSEKIIPALNNKVFVICDRFIDSSVVYQGIARNLGEEIVDIMNDFATDNIKPDLTFFLDVPAKIAVERRKRNLDRFELEGLSFYNKIYDGYKKVFGEPKNTKRAILIDGQIKPLEIHKKILSYLL